MQERHDSSLRFCDVDTADGKILVMFEVVRSRRLRYTRIAINDHNEVTLKLPVNVPEAEGLAFLKGHGEWLKRMLGRVTRRQTLFEYLQENPFVSKEGRKVPVTFRFKEGPPDLFYNDAEKTLALGIDPREPPGRRLANLLHEFSRPILRDRVRHLVAKTSVDAPARVTVRNQVSRWGSCSDRRTVSLNWRLILLQPSLQDYIIFHELAHLKHLNHSKQYWDLLREFDPKADQHDQHITDISRSIMSLGREK